MIKHILAFTLLLTMLANFTSFTAYAQAPDTCPPLFNGGIVCQEAKDFIIDKKVQTPKDGSYVDQIPQSETLITPEHTMIFRITVTNKTDKKLSGIAVKDILPNFVTFVKSDGDTKQNGDTVSYTVKSLDPKATSTMNIQAKVAATSELPKSETPLCVANQVEATLGFFNKQTAKDYATFCVSPSGQTSSGSTSGSTTSAPTFPGQNVDTTKGGLPTATTPQNQNMTKGGQTVYPTPNASQNPNTGPEALALIGLLPAGLGGFILRRKAR